jgi:arylsulfatase
MWVCIASKILFPIIVAFAPRFDRTSTDAPSTHTTQYFEMFGVQGLYHDGWILSAVPTRPPWSLVSAAVENPATAFRFELYDLRQRPSWPRYANA